MKNYEVIYNTPTMKAAHYAFNAETMEEATAKAPKLVTGEILKVVEVDDLGNLIEPVTVRTALAVGGTKKFEFDGHSIEMYDNKHFQKPYYSYGKFINDFFPNKPSDNLLAKIALVFATGGEVTYKPRGYRANMKFYFS